MENDLSKQYDREQDQLAKTAATALSVSKLVVRPHQSNKQRMSVARLHGL